MVKAELLPSGEYMMFNFQFVNLLFVGIVDLKSVVPSLWHFDSQTRVLGLLVAFASGWSVQVIVCTYVLNHTSGAGVVCSIVVALFGRVAPISLQGISLVDW